MTDQELIQATGKYMYDADIETGPFAWAHQPEEIRQHWYGQAKKIIEYLRKHDTNREATAEEIGRAILNTRI